MVNTLTSIPVSFLNAFSYGFPFDCSQFGDFGRKMWNNALLKSQNVTSNEISNWDSQCKNCTILRHGREGYHDLIMNDRAGPNNSTGPNWYGGPRFLSVIIKSGPWSVVNWSYLRTMILAQNYDPKWSGSWPNIFVRNSVVRSLNIKRVKWNKLN